MPSNRFMNILTNGYHKVTFVLGADDKAMVTLKSASDGNFYDEQAETKLLRALKTEITTSHQVREFRNSEIITSRNFVALQCSKSAMCELIKKLEGRMEHITVTESSAAIADKNFADIARAALEVGTPDASDNGFLTVLDKDHIEICH